MTRCPRIGSLCTGYGGLDLGVQDVYGGTVVWVSDLDSAACKILAVRHPDVPNLGDLTIVDWDEVAPIDILTAGYPCQPFSGNGRREGANDDRHIWPYILDAVRRLRPGLVVLENVEDHLTLGFDCVLGDLAEAGFDAEWCVLRASDVGAPHGRPRLFIAATDPGRVLHATAGHRRVAGALPSTPPPPSTKRQHGDGAHTAEDKGAADQRGDSDVLGPFAPAVRRWQGVLGWPAPPHVVRVPGEPDDIDMRFVEWTMGLPAGWVTDVPGLSADQVAHALGNGVVPQQAAAALRILAGAPS